MTNQIYNKVILQGYLGKKEYSTLKYTPSGMAVFNSQLGIGQKVGDKWQTQYMPIVAFKETAIALNEQNEGCKLNIEGSLHIRQYEDKTGSKKKVIEVIIRSFAPVFEADNKNVAFPDF